MSRSTTSSLQAAIPSRCRPRCLLMSSSRFSSLCIGLRRQLPLMQGDLELLDLLPQCSILFLELLVARPQLCLCLCLLGVACEALLFVVLDLLLEGGDVVLLAFADWSTEWG